jgi:riboflavin biosynthesis pyrimidine reductase
MGLRITANFALSADGKISTRGPGGSGFGSAEDHRRLLALRAQADAVLVGQATLVADRMSLGLGSTRAWRDQRLAAGRPEFPARVVVGGRRPLAPDHPVFSSSAGPLHFLLPPGQEGGGAGAKVHWHPAVENGTPDLLARIRSLAESEGWRHLHCEGGARIFNLLVQAGLVDTLFLTLVPVVFGGHAAPRLLPRDAAWASSMGFHLASMEAVGDELFLRYEMVTNP